MGQTGVRSIYLFGAGGHGRELGWLARDCFPGAELTYIVDDEQYLGGPVNDIPVQLITDVGAQAGTAFIAAVGDSAVRRTASELLSARGLSAVALVHPRVEASPTVRIAPGAVVAAGCVLTDNVELGAHTHVNIGCTLSHDVTVGEFVTISPGVHIAGNVTIGDGAFLGIGASVINGSTEVPLIIGAGAVVAAGACVIRSVGAGTVVGGVPAYPLRSGSES